MKKNPIIFFAAALLAVMATSCVKVIDKFNSNNITVSFNAPNATYVSADKAVNGKDSIDFSYSVSSTEPISYLSFTKNDTEISRDSVKTGDRMSFSAIKKLIADTIPGQYIFKVVARDNAGIYIGSSNPIVITVTSDMVYYTNKRIYVPDSTAKVNKTYFNFATETAYSYTDITAGNLSNQIDLGMFFDPATVSTPPKITLYNLSVTPLPAPVSIYDISAFTKNVTLLKQITTPTWANINSGALLKAQCATIFKTPTAAMNSVAALPAGSVVLFKTAAGRCGAINITYINAATASPITYMNFEVKLANP